VPTHSLTQPEAFSDNRIVTQPTIPTSNKSLQKHKCSDEVLLYYIASSEHTNRVCAHACMHASAVLVHCSELL